jgi:hypothetical protein
MTDPSTPLEQILGLVRVGANRHEVRACWPRDTTWKEKPNALICTTGAIPPFRAVEYVFAADALYNIRLVAVMEGDYEALERLEAQLLRQMPGLALEELGRPWSPESARSRLERRGSEKAMAAVMIEGRTAGGRLSGKAIAFKRGTAQLYGFELFWYPLNGGREPGPYPIPRARGSDPVGARSRPTPPPPGSPSSVPPKTRWVWIEAPEGGRVLAFTYVDPMGGPSAKGAVVSVPPTEADVRKAVDHPDRTFRRPDTFGAKPVSPEEALRLGLPGDPPWIGFFEGKPVPPPRGQPSRTVTGRVLRDGAPVAGIRVRLGHVAGPAHELLPLDERRTDKDGRFEFPLAPMDSVSVIAEGQGESSRITEVPDDTGLELTLEPVGALEGSIRRAGRPVEAQVSLVGLDGGPHRIARSGVDGRYRATDIVPGRYSVTVEALDADGMTNGPPVVEELEVADSRPVTRDFALAAGSVVRVSVLLDDDGQRGHVYLLAGRVAPQRESELRPLFASPVLRSANRLSIARRRMTTEFRDVVPGEYTVCVAPEERDVSRDPPVASLHVQVGAEPQTVEIILPR